MAVQCLALLPLSNSSGLESGMGFWGLLVLRYSENQRKFSTSPQETKTKTPSQKNIYIRFIHQINLQLVTLTIWSLWTAQWLHTAPQGGVNGRGQFSLYLWPIKLFSTGFIAAIMWYVLITHEILSDYLNEGLALKIIMCVAGCDGLGSKAQWTRKSSLCPCEYICSWITVFYIIVQL